MRILVTRPQPSAAATKARLEAMGHEAIVLPLAEAIHTPETGMDALAHPYTAIAITSAEAIRALDTDRSNLTPHLGTTIYCVGAATADVARQVGFRSIVTGPGTGAGLAERIIRDAAKNNGIDIVYLAGQPRSPNFEAVLREAGIACRVAEVYRMAPIAHSPDEVRERLGSRPNAVLFYSQETARQFFRLVTPQLLTDLQDVRLLCLSEHVASAVPEGAGKIAIAAAPNEDSLLALL